MASWSIEMASRGQATIASSTRSQLLVGFVVDHVSEAVVADREDLAADGRALTATVAAGDVVTILTPS